MPEEKKPQTFAEKYNLVGQGRKVEISEETRRQIIVLYRQSDRLIESGNDFARTCRWFIGPGCRRNVP